ncbi:hypothetical protein [Thalassorhabdomicrobium marinisediminis]|uniref:hypothetical protein n=1 Tax=Thalassorhabdomicrobium marinisediminis TaxID=2170577 RepID=UPI001F5473B4|nr:hypothetical protein [Thalassorhabdomicrobium marinisediminis]
MNLLGTKRLKQGAALALLGAVAACTAPLPGGETGPFAPGNTLTYYYQNVLTGMPEQAQIIDCGDQMFRKTCVQLSNGATFELEPTENGVSYGNDAQRVVLQPDPGGVPSGVGQMTDLTKDEVIGLRWVSLPSAGAVAASPATGG